MTWKSTSLLYCFENNLTIVLLSGFLFLISYTEKLWGEDADNLDPTISGGRLKVLNLRSLIKDVFAIKNNNSDHLEGAFYYPELGFGEIFDALGES